MGPRQWVCLAAMIAALGGVAACGGSSGGDGGGDGEGGATASDLANRSFLFPSDQELFDPGDALFGQDVILTVGSFDGNMAGMTLVGGTDGALLGGTLALGSCTLTVNFQDVGGEITLLDGAEGDNVAVLDPCEVGADGRLTITATDTGETFTSQPRTTPAVLAEATVPLAVVHEVPASLAGLALLEGRAETGTATFQLREGNVLSYSLTVNNLSAADSLVNAHIHEGSVTENGGIVITLAGGPAQLSGIRPVETLPRFDGGASVTASIPLSSAEVAALNDTDSELYVNVHSGQVGAGLVRGQLGKTIAFAANVGLSSANEVPPVEGRSETGLAVLRVEEDDTPALKFALDVFGLDTTDDLQIAHIHEGGASENGGILITLVGGPAQGTIRPVEVLPVFGGGTSVRDQVPITSDELAALNDSTQAIYVNVHSAQVGSGLVRGQIRDVDLVSLDGEVQPIFTANCAFAFGCHGGTSPAAGMSLEAGRSYGDLVNVPAQVTAPGDNVRVVPGNSGDSVLWQRISGQGLAAGESLMPSGASPLSSGDQQTIRDWIDQGAPDN